MSRERNVVNAFENMIELARLQFVRADGFRQIVGVRYGEKLRTGNAADALAHGGFMIRIRR